MSKVTLISRPEFASEIVCIVPYAYWLHQQDKLDKVITCKGMKPFYYFCDVEEKFDLRYLDHKQTGMDDVPNQWLHGNMRAPGVLEYDKWTPPPYKEKYKTDEFDDLKPYVVISNNYNVEGGRHISKAFRYFDMSVLSDLFTYLVNKGYNVIYKRPTNKEFTPDLNEQISLAQKHTLHTNLEGVGPVSDYEFCKYFNGKVFSVETIGEKWSAFQILNF